MNLYAYANQNPNNFIDPTGLTWGESLGMFTEWATGTGSDSRLFGPGSNQVQDMKDSPGVKAAKQYFYNKNANATCECGQGNYVALTNYSAGFGLGGYVNAGFDSTEQFVVSVPFFL